MITLNYLISDLELRLSKSKPSDDFELSKDQMAYWIDIARDEVTKLYVDQAKNIDNSIVMEVSGTAEFESGKVSIPIDVTPLDIKNGRGIVFVMDENGRYLSAKNNSMSKYISKLSFAKPSSCNPTYTFSGDGLELEGIDEDIDYANYTIGLVPSELSRRGKLYTEKYYILPSTVNAVLEMAEKIGIRELYGDGFYDVTDDGNSNNVAR